MKKLLRPLVYWPGMDGDLENWIKGCSVCQETSVIDKKKVSSSWKPSVKPMERVHIDFFNFEGRNFFLLMDTFTKDSVVKIMKKTTTIKVIEELENYFEDHGLPEIIVSDNGSPLKGEQFKKLWKVEKLNYYIHHLIHQKATVRQT